MKKELERDIQNAICDYLQMKRTKYLFWRQNTVGVFDKGRGTFRSMPKYGMRGVPDIIVVHRGGSVTFIECKTKKGKLSEDQEHFRKMCYVMDIPYLIARSVDDVVAFGL